MYWAQFRDDKRFSRKTQLLFRNENRWEKPIFNVKIERKMEHLAQTIGSESDKSYQLLCLRKQPVKMQMFYMLF